MIATTSTAEKAELLKALGASEAINYTETPNCDERAREPTDAAAVWIVSWRSAGPAQSRRR